MGIYVLLTYSQIRFDHRGGRVVGEHTIQDLGLKITKGQCASSYEGPVH